MANWTSFLAHLKQIWKVFSARPTTRTPFNRICKCGHPEADHVIKTDNTGGICLDEHCNCPRFTLDARMRTRTDMTQALLTDTTDASEATAIDKKAVPQKEVPPSD